MPPTTRPRRPHSRVRRTAVLALLAGGLACVPDGTSAQAPGPGARDADPDRARRVHHLISTLAHDTLRGRMTGSPGARSAARIIASELRSYGVEPAGDDGFFQEVRLVRSGADGGRARYRLAGEGEGPVDGEIVGRNVVGLIRGSDPGLADEVVLVGAHFDHLGVRDPVDGDSIYNGADDDASGVVAVLEAARSLAAGPVPDRTVVFVLSTAEEMGILGSRHYLRSPPIAMEQVVANLQVEMIGRPDPELGARGRLWLSGFERSTMGEILQEAGVDVHPDPRPSQRFFFRSDNVVFAMEGIPAHTLSSYGMHGDYHRPSDEVEAMDLEHLTLAAEGVVAAVRALARGPAPEWREGGRPRRGSR